MGAEEAEIKQTYPLPQKAHTSDGQIAASVQAWGSGGTIRESPTDSWSTEAEICRRRNVLEGRGFQIESTARAEGRGPGESTENPKTCNRTGTKQKRGSTARRGVFFQDFPPLEGKGWEGCGYVDP